VRWRATKDQLAKLSPFIGDQSFFMATYYIYFPLLTRATRGTPSIGSIVWRGPATFPSHPLGVVVLSMVAAGGRTPPDSLRYVGGDRRGTAAGSCRRGGPGGT
jgi:hypothetical protein